MDSELFQNPEVKAWFELCYGRRDRKSAVEMAVLIRSQATEEPLDINWYTSDCIWWEANERVECPDLEGFEAVQDWMAQQDSLESERLDQAEELITAYNTGMSRGYNSFLAFPLWNKNLARVLDNLGRA